MANKAIYWILGIYFLISLIFWNYSDNIGTWALTANPLIVTLVNFFTNPFYIGVVILIFEIFFRGYKLNRTIFNGIKVTIASVLISLSLDIVSIVHTLGFNYVIPNTPQTSIYFDTILGKVLASHLQILGSLGTFVIYVVIPLLMIILALFIASPSKFVQLFKSEFAH